MTQILFNMYINAVISFWGGLLIVAMVIYIFRIPPSRYALLLLGLPLIKIGWDLMAGIPSDSVLLHGIDPFVTPAGWQRHLVAGWGYNTFRLPYLAANFSMHDAALVKYSFSFGDLLSGYLMKTISPHAPALLLVMFGLIAIFLALFRAYHYVHFEKERRRDLRGEGCRPLQLVQLRWRKIDVYLSRTYVGTPFTGGILRPHICVPDAAYRHLSRAQFDAVVIHEIAHVRAFDVLYSLIVAFMGDIFWFVPGYQLLAKRIEQLREILADKAAIAVRHESAIDLAQALLKLQDECVGRTKIRLYSAFIKQEGLLGQRVKLLLREKPKTGRLGWQVAYLRPLFLILFCGAVLSSTFVGNRTAQWSDALPLWMQHLVGWFEGP